MRVLEPTRKKGLEYITDTQVFTKDGPTSGGLYSPIIYGKKVADQKKYALIALKYRVLVPNIFLNIGKIDPVFSKLVNNECGAIVSNGKLIETENKIKSGLNFLYDNWEKIDFSLYSHKEFDVQNFDKLDKNKLFITETVVLPAFYRPFVIKNGIPHEDELTSLYRSLLTLTSNKADNKYLQSLVQEDGTQLLVQKKLVEIQNFLLENYKDFQEENLISKRLDNITRLVANADPIIPLDSVAIPWTNLAIIFDTFVFATILHSPKKDYYLEKLGFDDMPNIEELGQFFDYIYRNTITFIKNSPEKKQIIIEILKELFDNKPELLVSVKRDPAWDKNSFHGLKPIINTDDADTIIVSSMIYKPLGGDSFSSKIIAYNKNTSVVVKNDDYICRVPTGTAKIIKRTDHIKKKEYSPIEDSYSIKDIIKC